MGSEGIGECSRKTAGDSGDDSSGDTDRPLKKARYVWQVKGKYHLKDSFNNGINNKDKNDYAESSSTNNLERDPEENLESKINNNTANSNNNNNNNNNVDCGGKCCIETLLARSEVLMAREESSDEENPAQNIDKSISDEIPITLVKPNPKNQDYYLMKWQARQVAKGYLDNTINRVLESWMVSPFDAADFVDNCDNDGKVEDEGILMAIQSHGLQPGTQNWGESSNNQDANNTEPTPMFLMRPQEIAESTLDNYQNVHNELLKRKSTEEDFTNCNEHSHAFENIEVGDHTNFLDAAVAVAIQKKGLASQNYV